MATVNELYQQYLLTQPGTSGSQNRYQQLLAQMQPFVNPYPSSTGLVSGTTTTTTPRRIIPMGTYSDSGGSSSSGGVTGGTGGTGSTGGGSGQGVNRDLQSIALTGLALTDNPIARGLAGFVPGGQLIRGGLNFLSGKLADAQIDAEGRVDQSLIDAANMGYGTRVGRDGNITSFVNDETLDRFDMENFLVNRAELDAIRAPGLIDQIADPRAYQNAVQVAQAVSQAIADRDEAQAQAQAVQDTAAVNVSSPTAVSMTSMQDALNRDTAAVNAAAQQAAQNAFSQALLSNAYGYQQQIEAAESSGGGSIGADYGGPADASRGGSPADADPGAGGYGGSIGVDYGGPADAGRGGSPADADPGAGGYGGYGGYDGGFGDGYNFFNGGKVTKNRLKGPDPEGPDDGTGLLQLGEFVLKKSAVKKYGEGLLSMINDGKIPAKKMKSLLG